MMNKCKGRMVQEYYIMENIFHKEGIEKWRRERVAITRTLILCLCNLYEHLPPQTENLSILAVVQFTKTYFFDPLSTNLFYWTH